MTDSLLLGRVRHFRSLSHAERQRLAAQCRPQALEPGEILFEEGQPCQGLFILVEGSIEVGQISIRGREQVLHAEGPGATLGEGPLFDRGGYVATAIATEPTRVLFLRRAALVDLCRRHPAVALSILETLARRMRRFAEIASDLSFRPVPERVARYIAALAGAAGPGSAIDLALTETQLAARLGTVRELVARALSDLAESGVIARRGARVVVVRDPARLAALASGDVPAARGQGRRVTKS